MSKRGERCGYRALNKKGFDLEAWASSKVQHKGGPRNPLTHEARADIKRAMELWAGGAKINLSRIHEEIVVGVHGIKCCLGAVRQYVKDHLPELWAKTRAPKQ